MVEPAASLQPPGVGDGSAAVVAPGVLWLRMPLASSLRFINVWALEDGDGWALVDTGLRGPETERAWTAAFAGNLAGRSVSRLIITHMHADHCGMAGWLTRRHQAPMWMTRGEYLTCRAALTQQPGRLTAQAANFYRAAGWSAQQITDQTPRLTGIRAISHPLPAHYRRITEGEALTVGGQAWRVVIGSGHSPEHACLHAPELDVFIAGDQVLPRFSATVGVTPLEPDADPLGEWLASLARIRAAVPDSVLVLPSHGDPFHGLHARIDAMLAHHQAALDRLQTALAAPLRGIDAVAPVTGRSPTDGNLPFATAEALAALAWLEARGKASRRRDPDGVDWWSRLV